MTPFASILKDIVHKNKVGANIACKKVVVVVIVVVYVCLFVYFVDIVYLGYTDSETVGVVP